MEGYTELYISGDLSQALAIREGQTFLFDRNGKREVSGHFVPRFFAMALDIESAPPLGLAELADEDVTARLLGAVLNFQTLHRLLVGMDGRLSSELRSRAISEADTKLQNAEVADAVGKRILRVPRGHDWRPKNAFQLAVNGESHRAADLYEVVASGILEGLEGLVWKRFGANGLGKARDFGLIANGARAISSRNAEIIVDAVTQSPRVVAPIAEAIRRYCLRTIDAETVTPSTTNTGAWRDLSPDATPSLEALLNDPIPAIDSGQPEQQSYPDWMRDHALHRRFYVSGLEPFLNQHGLTGRDAVWMTLLGPDFVIGKTSWSSAPGDWKHPASKLQFNRALRGEPLSLARACLVIASAGAAAIDRGANPEQVFRQLGLKPACFRIPILTDDLIYAMSQDDASFDGRLSVRSGRPRELLQDMAKGFTVTLQTARIVREILSSHEDSAMVGDVVGRPSPHTRGTSPREEVQVYQTLRDTAAKNLAAGGPSTSRKGSPSTPKDQFRLKSVTAWDAANAPLDVAPRSSKSWHSPSDIVRALTPVMGLNRNHSLLPTGGGLDLEGVKVARDPSCLEFSTGGRSVYIVKPKVLTFERLHDEGESFFLLELDDLKPSGVYDRDDKNEDTEEEPPSLRLRASEELVELSPENYVSREIWDRGFLGYQEDGSEIPLPATARLVSRFLGGKILIVAKASLWNRTSETYDGRHNQMASAQIRHVIERSIAAKS